MCKVDGQTNTSQSVVSHALKFAIKPSSSDFDFGLHFQLPPMTGLRDLGAGACFLTVAAFTTVAGLATVPDALITVAAGFTTVAPGFKIVAAGAVEPPITTREPMEVVGVRTVAARWDKEVVGVRTVAAPAPPMILAVPSVLLEFVTTLGDPIERVEAPSITRDPTELVGEAGMMELVGEAGTMVLAPPVITREPNDVVGTTAEAAFLLPCSSTPRRPCCSIVYTRAVHVPMLFVPAGASISPRVHAGPMAPHRISSR
jgi:hypothetical protein